MNAEFSVAGTRQYNRSSPLRWILSHEWQYKWFMLGALIPAIIMNIFNAIIPALIGRAFDDVLENPPDAAGLTKISVAILVIVLARGVFDMVGGFAPRCGPSARTRQPRRAVPQAARQEPDLSQPPACGRHHGARHQRCPPAQHDDQPGRRPDRRFDDRAVIPIIFIGLLDVRAARGAAHLHGRLLFALALLHAAAHPGQQGAAVAFGALNAAG